MTTYDGIKINPEPMGGKPAIRGVPVEIVGPASRAERTHFSATALGLEAT